MENREIMVANSHTQKKYKVTTNATTLGELKSALAANLNVLIFQSGQWIPNTSPIDFAGLGFTEGITNLTLNDDSSQLPTNVEYKGTVTNNLVMLLTNVQKNISSGANDRKGAYAIIKEKNLQSAIKGHFNANYTNLTTETLWNFINCFGSLDNEEANKQEGECCCDDRECDAYTNEERSEVADYIYDLTKALAVKGVLSLKNVDSLADRLAELYQRMLELAEAEGSVGNIEVSDEDIDNMLNRL